MCLKNLMRVGLAVIVGMIFSVSSVYACHPWINANKYKLEQKDVIRFFFAYGHNFPFGHSFYDNAQIGEMYILAPDGERQKAGPRALKDGEVSEVQFESKGRLKEGTYLVVMETKGHFSAKTTEGYQYKSKKELKGKKIEGKVSYSQMWAKAIVNVGEESGEGFSRILGHGLEIVPLKDPNELRANDFLPIKILHNGEPLKESVKVHATYMGFSNDTDVFAYTCWASSSKGGEAKIRILQPGIWKIYVDSKIPYPDQEAADQYSYYSTLTFEVKP